MSKFAFWFKNARNIALPQSILPTLTAIILCIGQEGFLWWLALHVLLGVCAAHLGMNLADAYYDFKHDSRIRVDINKIVYAHEWKSAIISFVAMRHLAKPRPRSPNSDGRLSLSLASQR